MQYRERGTMSSPLRFLALTTLTSLVIPVLTQDVRLVPTSASASFPTCALTCVLLQQAQSACVPPEAPISNQATYVDCFCQSAYLTALHSSPNGICDSSCSSESDRQLLQSWYNNFCSSGGNGAVITVSAATTTATASGAQATANSQETTSPASSGWLSDHWRWVVMLVVLAVGFGSLSGMGVWIKRRYDANHQNLHHGKSPTPGLFSSLAGAAPSVMNDKRLGPSQPTAHPLGFDFAPVDEPPPVISSSRTANSSSNTLVATPNAVTGRNSKRSDTKMRNGEDTIEEQSH